MITSVKTEIAKKVGTYDLSKVENGFLIEMFKNEDKTEVYMSCAKPGAFKGYHLHRVRAARYICVKGKMKIILYVDGKREEHILTEENLTRLYIPPNIPTGLQNIGDTDGWLVNYPDPAYDPSLKDEQVDFTQEELDSGEYRKKL
ncbi:WxcM-like domain-containing protein [Candidatus Woesebacteria bacterium]|nr:WxcM-like domain-containing protein [Candidatus Woesebacteria bacterium]